MKFLRYIQKKRRAMFAMAALTFFASPFTAHASNITTKAGVKLNPTNNVFNIEIQKKLSNSVGVNKFTHFELDKGHIANLKFDKLNTLANLVDNRISINGTVNALRDGKIGGNLYFLSPNGIAVGASGVINAGSFTGMAVSKDYFENLSKIDDATKFTNALKPENIEYNNNPEKGIDIQGVINAPGGISLYATKIDVGTNAILRTDVEEVDFTKVVNIEGVDSGITGGLDASYKDGDIILKAYAESINDASTLTTQKEIEKAASDWEKITEREATINIDGKIRSANDVSINAESVVVFKENKNFNVVTQAPILGGLIKKANLDATLNFAKKTSKASVNISNNADIYSAGDMDISATSTLNVAIETVTPAQGKSKKYIPATAVGVIVAENEASVSITGAKLESKGRMAINATANTTLNVDAKTRTNIEDKKDKPSSDSSSDSKSDASTDSSKSDSDTTKTDSSTNTDSSTDTSKTDASSDSSKTDSSSDSSKTDSSSDSSSTDDTSSDVVEDRFYVAVGVIAGSSKAELNINSDIKVGGTDTKDKSGNEIKAFEANAIVNNDLSISANAASKDKSTINTAVGVVAYNSKAVIDIQKNITAENGSININATNSTTNSGNISNVLGSEVAPFENPFILDPDNTDTGNTDTSKTDAGKTDSGNTDTKSEEGKESEDGGLADEAKKIGKQLLDTEEAKKFIEEAKSTGKELLNTVKTKLKELVKGKDSDKKDDENKTVPNKVGGKTFTKILDGEYLKAGVAVGVISESNTANVQIAHANLTAKNDVAINALTEITRQNISVESDVNNIKEDQKTASMIGLGVLVTDIDNNADISMINTPVTANEGDVSITSDSGMKYDQFGVLVGDLKESLTKIKEDAKKLGEEVEKDVSEKIDGYLKQLNDGISDDKSSSDSKSQKAGSDDASTLKGNLAKLKSNVNKIAENAKKDFNGIITKVKNSQLKEDIGNLASDLTAFVHPANYANYYVRSAFNDSKDVDDETASKVDAAGSISIDTMRNNSRIAIGRDSKVNAAGSVDIDSTAKGGVVAVTGMGGEFLTSSEAAKNGAGISVIVGNFKNNSVVALGKTNINSNDISLKTTDDTKHVNIIYGNGKADSTSITGMASYIGSPTNSIISIDDSAKLNAANDINLEATGKDYITSVNGGIALGNGNGKSFGAAINVLSNDKNVAVNIGDNGYLNAKFTDNIPAFTSKISSLSSDNVSDKTEIKILKINKATHEILGENMFGKLGASAVTSDGTINAKNLTVKSNNTGTINSIAVEGSENSESHGFADGFNDKVYKGETFINYADDSFKWMSTKLLDAFTIKDKKLDKSGEKKPSDAGKEAGSEAGNEGDNNGAASNLGVDNSVQSQLNIAGAGSAAININSGETGSFVSNANLTADTVNVNANDDTFKGSWAGAGAFNFFGNSNAAKNTNVAIGGSVAYSDNSRNVDAIIKNSTINNATSIKNSATRDDSDVAAGMGLAVSTSKSEGSSTDIAVSASINFINGDTHALLIGVREKGNGTSIENKASIDALQVSGGLDVTGSTSGGKGFSIGGSAAASKITNDLQSGIKGGSYENLGKVDITADKKSNQIDVAVAGGIDVGILGDEEDSSGGFAFGGGVAVSDINNTSHAFLSDTTKFSSSGVVNVDALDSKNSGNRNEYLSSRSINIDPTSYLDDSDKSKVNPNGGGNIVNVAFGGGASTSDAGSSGLGISYAGISNLVNVDISNNNALSAQNLNANTTNKSNIVNVTVGIAGATKSFSGAGSAGVSDINNDGTINITNSNVTTDNDFLSSAQSTAHIINVAGESALSSEFASGLTFAYNAMNNTTDINVSGGNWNVKNFSANSINNNYALAVGAGVAFSKSSTALNGSVGLNMGRNSTKAILDGSTLNGIQNVNVSATDKTSKTTVAGGFTIGLDGLVGAGGAVAYANIGTASNKEVINAQITNSTISAKSINVEALDNATMTTVGVGAGGSISDGKLTFQGAAAVSELNKDNLAEISNSTITGDADIKVIATSGGNSSNGLTINDKNINVNNKINTAAAVLDANFSKEPWFDGVFAISINKFNQNSTANFKNTTQPKTTSQAGNVNVYSNSEGDILSVSAGGAGGQGKVNAAGSTSLNYINNSAKSLAENLNVKAAKNFGVVAQSDDKLSNYSGTIHIDANGYASIGVSVSKNELTGNTDANIKNSKLEVTGSDSDLIAISNPQNNLIDGYVTKNNWISSGLFNGRISENKSGLVVNSSATHSISSDLATIGVRASSDKAGVGVSGTVNINKISGATNATLEGTNVVGNADSFVNASDYTNNGSFIGNASASGTVAIGILWNENKVERKTNSLVDGGTLNVKNLNVTADNRQGLSNLNIAVGVGFVANKSQVFAAASGDNVVRNQLEGVTSAKIENATVNHSDAVNVNAYHKDNIYATNIAAGVAVDTNSAGATFDMGYGLMRENSTVNAEINNSTLTSTSGAAKVNAENDSKLAGAFGTAGIAVHAGMPGFAGAVALGINNNYVTNTVHAGIKGSTLNVGNVDVNARNTSEVKADGGVAAVALNISKAFVAAMGAAVAVTNATFDNAVTADVDSSTITATNVNINARDDHKANETVVSAALSTGLAVSVNRMSTSINNGLANLNENQLGNALSSGDLTMTPSNASKNNADSDGDKLTGEYGAESRYLNEEAVNSLLSGVRAPKSSTQDISNIIKKRYKATVNYNNSLKKGVFANVQNGSTITATNDISINSTENNDLSITSGSGNAGIFGIGVGSTSIKAKRANTSNVIGSSLTAQNVDITTSNGQTGSDGINSKMYNATLTALGASVGYNNVETNGTGEILISNSKITATNNINAKALDNSKSRSYVLDAGFKGLGYTGVFTYNTNLSQTGIEVSNKSALNAQNINFDAQNQTYRATDTLAISVGAITVPNSTSDAEDRSNNFINVNGSGNSFTADNLTFNAINGGQTYSHTNGQAYLGLNTILADGFATSYTNADIYVASGNSFLNKTATLNAQIGEDGKYTAEATGFAINGSAVGVNVDDMTARTNSTANIQIGNEYFSEDTTLNLSALNKASRNAFMRNNAYSLVANANDISAYTKANDTASVTVGNNSKLANSNKLGALNITADTQNNSHVAAKGTGGSIGGDFGSAAHADNDVNNTSEATLKGTWNIAGDLTLTATQHDNAYISGYSARGAIFTGGKGSLDNVIKGNSTAKIASGANINAQTVNVNAKNYIKTDKYSDDYEYTLFGRMGGVVDDVDYQRSTATTDKTADINIGNKATVISTGKQIYDAASDYNLKNNVYGDGGSLLASLRWAKSHNYITANENITVGTDASVRNEGGSYSDGGVILAAHDNLELNPTAKGYSKAGFGGYVRAEALTELTRNQNININGTVKSARDLNIYAGADTNGEGSKVYSKAQSISQVQTLITDGKAEIIRKGSTNSNVNVKRDAYGQATHDVNIISNAGNETYNEFAFYGSTWSSDTNYKVATADNGNLTTSDYTHNSKVKVDGELKAASTSDATINISGVAIPDGFVLNDNKAKLLSYSVKSGNYTVTNKSTDFTGKSSEEVFAQLLYNGIETATKDYPNDYLVKRYGEVEKLMGTYQGDVAAYSGLQQEKTALENEMVKLGMGKYNIDSEGNRTFTRDTAVSINIKTLTLPDVEVSGGSINVITNDFTGTGKLDAKGNGTPKIDVNNNSTAYLITGKLTIADKGGNISYNGQAVKNNAAINELNASKIGSAFAEMKIGDSADTPTITVTNSYAGSGSIPMKPDKNAKGYSDLPEKAKTETQQYTPINFVEVAKDITNPVGNVVINNNQGSIRINRNASVNALDIKMTAKESISQGFTEGIVNIADTPEYSYADEAAKLRKTTGWDAKMPESNQNKTATSNWQYSGGTGRIAGEAIYIAARDININGLIQSGYNGFKANITQRDVDNAKESVFFNGVSMYKVNDGGTKLGSDGYYIYEPQVYYDKANNRLYVEDINSTGGKVYLSGRILSTGNGKIVVTDGGGNIDITNSSKVDMSLGKVTSSPGGGFIQIVDTAQDKLTEYSSGQTRTINNYSAWLADNTKGKVTTSDGLSIGQFTTYNPQANLTYNWAEGQKQSTTYHYYKDEKRGWWGASSDSSYTGKIEDMSTVSTQVGEPEKTNDPLGKGTFIATSEQADNLKMSAQNSTSTIYWNDPAYMTESGLGGFYHHWHHNWYKEVGSRQTYVYTLKASNPISVGILGESNPHINVTNEFKRSGDLYLGGNIRNDNGATLNITASGGKIEQAEGFKITTDNIKLTARDAIKNVDITNNRADDLKLNAQAELGDVDINVSGGTKAGNVLVEKLSSANGGVTLKATGDIKQTIKGTAVTGRNIKLESTNGSINLQIESGGQGANVSAISAAANGDITLIKNDTADFLVGSIVSTTGDVTLTAKGKFVDALDKVRDNAENDQSELVKSWIDMGLIAGTSDYKGAYITRLEQDRDNYKSDVTEQFSEYKTLLASYQSKVDDYNALKTELDNSKPVESARLQELAKKFGDSKTVADDLAAEFEEYQILKSAYDGAVKSYEELKTRTEEAKPTQNDRLTLLNKKFANYETADAYLAADKDYQTLVATVKNPVYTWTEGELLSGIRSAIVNKQEGTAYDVTRLKDANITGRNVTLTGTGVGSNSKEVTTIKMSELRVKANETDKEKSARLAKVSKLANVEAADVTVHYVTGKDGKPVVQTVTQINYNYDADKGYYIDTAGNYIRYRKDADGNLLKYTYDKDLKQVGDAVAVNDFSDVIKDTTTIENKEIASFDISGTIPLGINATGNINIKTTGNDGVYIAGRNKGVKIDEATNPNNDIYSALNVAKVETAKADGNYGDVRIIGEKGIFNAAASGANVIGKDLVLVGGNGAIGTQAKPLTVTLTGDLLNARSNDEINLQKVGKDNFRISAMYSPKAIRIANDNNGIIEHSTRFDDIAAAYINSAGEITLTGNTGTADNPILIRPTATTTLNLLPSPISLFPTFYIKGLNTGTVNLNDISGRVDVSSEGSIGQTATGANNAISLKVSATGDAKLTGNNKMRVIDVGAVGGTFALNNDSERLTANFGGKVGTAQITQTGDINLSGTFNGDVLSLTTAKGNIISTGGLKATKEINLSVGNFTHEGEIHTDKLTIATDNGVTINNTENTFNALAIASRDGNAINGSINVAMKADKFAPTIKNDVAGDVTFENTKTGGLLSYGDGETINISGKFTAKTNVGDFDYGSTMTAKEISVVAQNIYKRSGASGNFSATDALTFTAQNNVGSAANPIEFGNTAEKSVGADLSGKGIYVKGVNGGMLTIGDVTGTTFSASSEGSIVQGNGKSISADKLTASAAKDITLDNAGNLIKAATITGGENVKLSSAAPDGLKLEGLKVTGDVNITSDKSLTLNGNIETDKDIALTAGTNLTSDKNSTLKSNKQIALNADDIKLSGKVETAYKDMNVAKVEDLEQFIKEMPVVLVKTNKGLDMSNGSNDFEGLYVDSAGDELSGSVVVTGKNAGFLVVIDKPVASDITLKNTQSNGAILLLDKETLQSTNGSITLDMNGDFGAGAALSAGNNINITSRKGSVDIAKLSTLEGKETADLSATLRAGKDIKLKAGKVIGIAGQITAGRHVITDSAGINVIGNADISAGKNIDLTVKGGNIGITGSATSTNGNVTMSIDKGDLTIEGKLRANNGEIAIELDEGNIQIGNDTAKQNNDTVVYAKNDISISTDNGIIKILGKNESTAGNINVRAQNPAGENNTPANVIEVGNIAEEEVADIFIDAELKANESIWIVTDDGDVEIDEKITVTNGDIIIATADGEIVINSNGADDMLRAQNDLNIETLNGFVEIAGKIATQDGDISITSNHDTYVRRQKGITVEETGEINPGRNVYLNANNGSIEFKNVAAKNANIWTINGNVTAETISADDNIHIEIEHGNLYLNLAQSKGVAILTSDSSESSVNTIRANSVDVDDAVKVGRILAYSSGSGSSGDYQGASRGYSGYYGTGYSTGYSNFASNSNFARSSNPYAILGTTYTRSGLGVSDEHSFLIPNNALRITHYAFLIDIDDRQTRNYFEVRYIPTWLEKEFLSIDFDYSFDNFGIKNATEDELNIE